MNSSVQVTMAPDIEVITTADWKALQHLYAYSAEWNVDLTTNRMHIYFGTHSEVYKKLESQTPDLQKRSICLTRGTQTATYPC